MSAVRENGTCIRCQEKFGGGGTCTNCGVGRERVVRDQRRNRPIGGKRGRNSGTVGSSKVKK